MEEEPVLDSQSLVDSVAKEETKVVVRDDTAVQPYNVLRLASRGIALGRFIAQSSFEIAKFSTRLGLSIARRVSSPVPLVGTVMSVAEFFSVAGIEIAQRTTDFSLRTVGSTVRGFDEVFGQSETADAITDFLQLVRREFRGSTDFSASDWLQGCIAWALLQRACREQWFRSLDQHLIAVTHVAEVREDLGVPSFPELAPVNGHRDRRYSGRFAAIRRFAMFSEAAYGRRASGFLRGSGGILPESLPNPLALEEIPRYKGEHDGFCSSADIPLEALVYSSWCMSSDAFNDMWGTTKVVYQPTFFLVLDHTTHSLVLVLRGTLSVHDLMVDLTCEYEDLALGVDDVNSSAAPVIGRVHGGMLKAARILGLPGNRIGLYEEVRRWLVQYPTYQLIITGHSLGAGVATILALLWASPSTAVTTSSSGLPVGRGVHCYAYAAPCTLDALTSARCKPLITTIAYGWDMVCRLSLGSVRDIRNIGEYFQAHQGIRNRLLSSAIAAVPNWAREQRVIVETECLNAEKLYPGGTIYWIGKRKSAGIGSDDIGGALSPQEELRVLEVDNVERCFGEIVFCRSMFSDHLPHLYHDAIVSLGSAEGPDAAADHSSD